MNGIWLGLWSLLSGGRRRPRHSPGVPRYRWRPQLESLEDRLVPTMTLAPDLPGMAGVTILPRGGHLFVPKLQVHFYGGNGPDQFTLNASFLQGGRARRPTGVAPGDLFFVGGQGDDSFRMFLSGPDGLPLSGDVYGGTGFNSCFHTRNVRTHNIQHDITPGGKQTVTEKGFPFPR
jgi:hypothetical protein